MVIVLDAQAAVTPEGNPVAVPIPVAPEVICVILVNGVLIHRVGELDEALAVLFGDTVTELLVTRFPQALLKLYVNLTIPAVTPVTTPAVETVAEPVPFTIAQVPPACELVNAAVLPPMQTLKAPAPLTKFEVVPVFVKETNVAVFAAAVLSVKVVIAVFAPSAVPWLQS